VCCVIVCDCVRVCVCQRTCARPSGYACVCVHGCLWEEQRLQNMEAAVRRCDAGFQLALARSRVRWPAGMRETRECTPTARKVSRDTSTCRKIHAATAQDRLSAAHAHTCAASVGADFVPADSSSAIHMRVSRTHRQQRMPPKARIWRRQSTRGATPSAHSSRDSDGRRARAEAGDRRSLRHFLIRTKCANERCFHASIVVLNTFSLDRNGTREEPGEEGCRAVG
jgi:hypothetical protein